MRVICRFRRENEGEKRGEKRIWRDKFFRRYTYNFME